MRPLTVLVLQNDINEIHRYFGLAEHRESIEPSVFERCLQLEIDERTAVPVYGCPPSHTCPFCQYSVATHVGLLIPLFLFKQQGPGAGPQNPKRMRAEGRNWKQFVSAPHM